MVAGWWEWHGGKGRAVAAKSAHSAALLDRLWNINLQHYRPEERPSPSPLPLLSLSGCMQLPRHPKPAQITCNHLEWILNFSTPPSLPIHRRIARQLDYQFIHSRWKNDRCNAFYRTRRWKPAVKTWSRFRFQRFAPTNLSRRIFIRISPVSVLRMYVCTWLFLDIGDTCESRHFPGSNAKIIVVGLTENRDARIRYDSGYNNKRMTVLSRAFLFPFNKRRPTFRWRNISNLAKFVSIRSIDRSRRRSSWSNKTNRHCSLFPFFPFYIHEPLTLSRGWTAITGEEEFSRETLGHTFLSNSLLPSP